MRAFWFLAACAVGMVLAQDVVPGASLYHDGWYNALDIGVLVIAAMQMQGAQRRTAGALTALFAAAVIVVAGAASGLMGPDTRTIVGAPGTSVRSDDLSGTFIFPLAHRGGSVVVDLQRGRGLSAIGSGRRYTGGFVLWQKQRPVVDVSAFDARGNHLTVTQPTNASFLSPVLLMQGETAIAGMSVRYDSFAVPAVQRTVKAVLFSPAQAAQLRATPPIVGNYAILFDVVPGGIGLEPSGGERSIGGVRLRARVESYPAVVVASAPYLPVLAIGVLAFLLGIARSVIPQRA